MTAAPNMEKLGPWLVEHIAAYSGELVIKPFSIGQSNPTYQLVTPSRRYVLRRKPMGNLLPSAHAVDREYRVISALAAADFPVPRARALCLDPEVIGSIFYVMDMVEGRIFCDGMLPDLERHERRGIYFECMRVLARLHRISPAKVGLADYGRPGNYYVRQFKRWTSQYRAAQTVTIDAMETLIDLLPKIVPEEMHGAIVHGDYRLDNLIFAQDSPTISAVLDWELSTLGDPGSDLAFFLMNWAMPVDASPNRSGFADLDWRAAGIPEPREIVAAYEQERGQKIRADLRWKVAFNLFRLAAIYQGIVARARSGNAVNDQAESYSHRVGPLADIALAIAQGSDSLELG